MRRLAVSLGMLCFVCSLAGGATTNQISQYGITWTFNGQYEYGQFATGDYWVVGPVTITSISPLSTEISGRVKNGSMINPTTNEQAFDSSMYSSDWNASLSVALDVSAGNPLVVPNGSSLISTISDPVPDARPQLTDAVILTVLSSAPAAGSFRPAYFGTDKSIRGNISDLDYTVLPKFDAVAGTPTLSTVAADFQRPWLDFCMPLGREAHPSNNMPSYGFNIAMAIGDGMLSLLLDYTDAAKESLLVGLTQVGLDMLAKHKSGRNWY